MSSHSEHGPSRTPRMGQPHLGVNLLSPGRDRVLWSRGNTFGRGIWGGVGARRGGPLLSSGAPLGAGQGAVAREEPVEAALVVGCQ